MITLKIPTIYLAIFLVMGLAACSNKEWPGTALPASERPLTGSQVEGEMLRRVPVEGAHNFRDIGGYKTSDGRTVKWNTIYRSSKLNNLDEQDVEYLRRLNIATLMDLRTPEKWEEEPSRLPQPTEIEIKQRPIASGEIGKSEVVDGLLNGKTNREAAMNYMKNVYVDNVKSYPEVFSEILNDAANQNATPFLYHCSAGKDRTGIATAIILLSLGVPRETVMQDYLLSNRYNQETIDERVTQVNWYSFFRADEEATRALMGVKREYLQAAFDYMESEYGSIDNYLKQVLKLDEELKAKLRQNLLQPSHKD